MLQKLTTLLSLAPALAPALAANRTHYGDPNPHPLQPCLADEVRAQITGLAGDLCIPPCDAAGKCPQDKPAGVEAVPQCVLKSSTGAQVSIVFEKEKVIWDQIWKQIWRIRRWMGPIAGWVRLLDVVYTHSSRQCRQCRQNADKMQTNAH